MHDLMELATDGRGQAPMHAAVDFETEQSACPLCAGPSAEPTRYLQRPFAVVRCRACRLWYLSPRLPERAMHAQYADDGYFAGAARVGYAGYERQERSLRRTYRRLLRRLADADMTGGDLLEIGAGHGYFLAEAQAYFRRRVGTELSAAAAAKASRAADAVHLGSIDSVPAGERFDCIAAFHVIEHVYSPVEFVRALAARLRANGVLVLSAPDMGGFWRMLLGRRWPSFKYPEHVAFYDRSTLPRLFERAGFRSPTRIRCLHDFPLSEIVGQLGIKQRKLPFDVSIPLPATTICYAVRASSR